MSKAQRNYLAGIRRHALKAVVVLAVPLSALGLASPAMASPKGIFSVFAQCPTTEPGVTLCNFGQTTSGEFVLGSTKVPINKTITIQGGAIPTGNPENSKEYFLVPAKNGESLSKTELNVPGGLTDLINCEEITGEGWFEKEVRAACKSVFEGTLLGVTATTELAATEKNPPILNIVALSREEGTALTLPVKVHLKNPLLGNSCYIGSEAHPLQLHLTTGATSPPAGFKSIHGARGEAETLEEKEQVMLRLFDNSLVDNTFASPGAEGCGELFGYTGFLDSIVDAKLKIPNTAGNNVAVLNGELKTATSEAVIASESF
jgi:hypothetical protein